MKVWTPRFRRLTPEATRPARRTALCCRWGRSPSWGLPETRLQGHDRDSHPTPTSYCGGSCPLHHDCCLHFKYQTLQDFADFYEPKILLQISMLSRACDGLLCTRAHGATPPHTWCSHTAQRRQRAKEFTEKEHSFREKVRRETVTMLCRHP